MIALQNTSKYKPQNEIYLNVNLIPIIRGHHAEIIENNSCNKVKITNLYKFNLTLCNILLYRFLSPCFVVCV